MPRPVPRDICDLYIRCKHYINIYLYVDKLFNELKCSHSKSLFSGRAVVYFLNWDSNVGECELCDDVL